MTIEVLEAEALRLSAAERARLVERLITSLDADPEVEEAWSAEVERRNAEIESGAVALLPGPETLARLKAESSPFVLTEDHEGWAKRASGKYRRSREYWREIICRQHGICAFSEAPLFFDAASGTPVKGEGSQHPLYAVVDHCAPGSDDYGHEIVCNDLNDIKGHLPYDCFQALRATDVWQQFMQRWRQQAERNPDRSALRALRQGGCA